MCQEEHDWCTEALQALRRAVELNLRELRHAFKQRPIGTVAWIARNLLELFIWVEYCKSSQERAKRFCEDCARDALGMLDIPTELFARDQTFSFRAERERLIEKAKQSGIEKAEDPFLRVSKAAEELDLKELFVYSNKLFSKFAHPTAIAVMNKLPSEVVRSFKRIFQEGGMCYGKDALAQIDRCLGAKPSRANSYR